MKCLLIVLSFLPACSFAQLYAVDIIPDSLKQNANAVMRYEEKKLIVFSPSRAIVRHKYAVTIMGPGGDDYAEYQSYYSSMQQLSYITGNLYDATGKKLRSVKQKDIADVSYSDGFSLMQDGRIKSHNFNYSQYPYTVEYEDEVMLNGFIGFPTWQPVGNQKYAVQQSSLVVEVPSDYKIRMKALNDPGTPAVVEKDKRLTYTWQFKNFKAFVYEPLQPAYREVLPAVYLAPSQFSYGGVSGEMDTWYSFGKYQVELNKGRDKLPEHIKQQVKTLTEGITDTREKIRVLYEYMQSNTRYISVQLGIGGLQPFDANYVATKKYGDCKALSNYMVALLKEGGINGYYSIIKAGQGEKYYLPDFPSDQTNHIVVGVPLEKDTMWLECTSQTVAAGYLGGFTDDRYALMIKEDGGYLVKTPSYKKEDNLQVRNIKATVNEDGQLVADVSSRYTGIQQDDLHLALHGKPKEKLLEQLKTTLPFSTYDVTALEYREHKKQLPAIDETYRLVVENYASISGKRLFITPNLLTQQSTKLEEMDRRFDINYDYSFIDRDTVSLTIPQGYTIEAMPKDIHVSNKFGKYSIQYKVDKNLVEVYRTHERTASRFPASDYKQYVGFVNEMFKTDRSRIVFIKAM